MLEVRRTDHGRRCARWLAAAVLSAWGGGAVAGTDPAEESEDLPPLRLGEVTVVSRAVVEADRLGKFADRITQVSRDQIESLNAQDVSGAVRRIPGVTVSRFNAVGAYGGGAGGAVYIRGHGASRPGGEISTRLDGIARFNGVWTHPLLDTLSVDTAEAIEVYKSPQPVLGGNMAFGVIDMMPRRHEGEGFATRLVGTAGSYETLTGRFEHGGRLGPLDYLFIGSHRESDGHRDNADGRTDALYGNLGLRLDENWELRYLASYSEGYASDPRAEGAPPIPMVERYNTRSLFHLAKLSHEHDWGTGHLKVYYEDGWALWEQWDAANADAHDHRPETVTYGAHLREDLHLWTNGTLTLGLDQDYAGGEASDTYHTQTASSYTFDRVTFRNTAPYLLVSHTFGDQVKVTPSAGVRYNFSRHFDDEWGAQAGLRVAFGDTELYANAARAFNYPGVYTAVFSRSFWAFKPVATLDDWEGLDAETVEHIEAGVVHRFLPWLSAELSAYRDEVEDAVRIAAPPAYPPPPRFAPIGSYTVEGVEASLRASPWSCLDVYVGVNAMHTDPGDVPDAPDWSASAGITWRPYHRLTLNLDAEFVGERCVVNTRVAGTAQEEVGRHLLLDARGAFRLTPAGSRVQAEVFAVVENLTDEEYEYQPDYPMPGATFTAGLDVRF